MSAVTSHAGTLPRPQLHIRTASRRDPWRGVRTVLRYTLLLIVLVFCLFPILWVVATSVKLPSEYLRNPPVWIPEHPTLVHFGNVMAQKGNLALKNSVIISTGATIFSMLVGSLAAYSLARLDTGGRHFAFWLLSQRLMPPVVLVVPFFLLLRDLGRINPALGLDSHAALIALYTVFNLPFVIWMMRSYFAAVPAEIEESALVDGATRLKAFRGITLPLAVPGLIATGTFAFIFSWMEFLFAVVFTRTKAVTLPVAIAGFSGSQGSNWGQASALAVVAMLPVFGLAMLVQRHFVRGLTLGAVRG
ncbi:MAG: carbohydrate ABC transporter permease [Chloroflexota bacterium]|nr:carbohydrate ABC transporter permease [Chloroflexota bacterium]